MWAYQGHMLCLNSHKLLFNLQKKKFAYLCKTFKLFHIYISSSSSFQKTILCPFNGPHNHIQPQGP